MNLCFCFIDKKLLTYLICFNASFTTCSTGRSGCALRISTTTLADGAGEKPSMVRALTASSFTSLFTITTLPPLAGSSSAMPRLTILSFRSMMIRCAVFSQIPFTVFSTLSLPVEMISQSSRGESEERIIRAVFPPTPETVMRRR